MDALELIARANLLLTWAACALVAVAAITLLVVYLRGGRGDIDPITILPACLVVFAVSTYVLLT